MPYNSHSFAFQPRKKNTYLCIFIGCKDNAAISLRQGMCAKHTKLNLSDEAILKLKITRDREIRKFSR